MPKFIRRGATALAAALVVFVLQAPALQALGPTVLMFYGGSLTQPVFVSGADAAAFDGLLEPTTVPAKETAGRPFVNVALFWGNPTEPASNGVRVISDLRPEMAWQHGRFFPATATQPALLLTTAFTKSTQRVPPADNATVYTWGGRVGPRALDVLQRLKLTPR